MDLLSIKKRIVDELIKFGIIKGIKPKIEIVNEEDKEIEFFISQPMRLADRCMKKLFSDDSFYSSARFAHVRPEDAKKMFLYGSARQVFKASAALMQYGDLIKGPPDPGKDPDTQGRAIIEAFVDEQNYWIRKLLELSINVINFTTTDIPELYRVYLNAENFNHFSGKNQDLLEFYDMKSGNIQHSIDSYWQRMSEDLKTLKLDEVWFLNKAKFVKKERGVFSSVSSRFKKAILVAKPEEILAIGPTYNDVYSSASFSVHPMFGSSFREERFETLRLKIVSISLLGQHILDRVNGLAGFEEPESVTGKMKETSVAPQLITQFKKEFKVGDLVIVHDELAEVLECRKSKFGYTGYKIKFLVRPLIAELPEDWVSSGSVMNLLPKENARAMVEKSFSMTKDPIFTPELRAGVMAQSDEELLAVVKGLYIDLHKHGILIPMLLESQRKSKELQNKKK